MNPTQKRLSERERRKLVADLNPLQQICQHPRDLGSFAIMGMGIVALLGRPCPTQAPSKILLLVTAAAQTPIAHLSLVSLEVRSSLLHVRALVSACACARKRLDDILRRSQLQVGGASDNLV
eukprot:762867-Hanusia_phi.AAC.3